MDRYYLDSIRLKRSLPPESWLGDLPAVRSLREGLSFCQPVTFLVGENGTGKSTLLEAMAVACGFNPEGGTRNFTFSTRATHSELHEYLTVARKAYPRDGFFSERRAFTTSPPTSMSWTRSPVPAPVSSTATAACPSTASPTGRAF